MITATPEPTKPPALFRATVGRCRSYQSMADVRAYEEGYRSYPHGAPLKNTPASDGWYDAEKRDQVWR